MKYWRGVSAGVLAYVVFLVVAAPAAKVLPFVQPHLQGVRLAGVDGSIWSGSAAVVDANPVQLQDVRWEFRPFALLLGRAELAVEGKLQESVIRAVAGKGLFGQRYLKDVRGAVSANDLLYWLQIRQVKVEGNLDFNLEDVRWPANGMPAIAGTAIWTPAAVSAPIELMLGKARLETQIDGDRTIGKLQASDGALLVQADVELNPGGQYRLDAAIQQKGDVPQAVSKFLSTFTEYKDGVYQLEWSDSL